MALHWTSALAIGVPEIDAQHEELFRRVDQLEDAVLARDRAGAVCVLRFLRGYVHEHLAAEESLMAALGYPGQAEHVAEHRAFGEAIERLARTLDAEGATASLVHRMEREVTGWLRDHVYSADLALGLYVRTHGRGTEAR